MFIEMATPTEVRGYYPLLSTQVSNIAEYFLKYENTLCFKHLRMEAKSIKSVKSLRPL